MTGRLSFGTLRAGLVAAALVTVSSVAQAQFFVNTFGLTSPISTVTFSEFAFAQGTSITNEFSSLGVTLSPGLQYNSQGGTFGFSGITGDYVGNNGGQFINPFSILFNSAQTAAAFAAATNPTTTFFEALLGGSVVASGTSATNFSDPNAYYGFTGVVFDEIRVTVGGDQQMLVDNVQLGNGTVVPEPGTFALLAAMLIPGAALLRRRAKS